LNCFGEIVHAERLSDEVHTFIQYAMMRDDVG
jgi:hypothetical protein